MSKKEEQLVCEIINNKIAVEDKRLPLYDNAIEISKFIIKKYGRPINATWIGNCHSFRGDIILKYPKKYLEVELKVISSSSTSKGTLANLTQDFFSKYGLINDAVGWSTWREQHSYNKTILDLLNKIDFTDDEVNNISSKVANSASDIESLARNLKNRLDKNGIKGKALASKARKIMENGYKSLKNEIIESLKVLISIDETARDDISKYLFDCKEKEINLERFKNFIACLKFGYHTEETINENIDKPLNQIINESKNYMIVYYYPNKELDNRFKIEDGQKISSWIKQIQKHNGVFDNESFLIKYKNRTLLKFKFHWRNVFFGIATPSIEVFDYLDSNNP